ncbi:MAG: T9SS type A sorting domain-containing protein [Paludibacteraceae bacterium]|nr:T9SS type A sorting domain-containing protein [Paludibacteraceae bacterium]
MNRITLIIALLLIAIAAMAETALIIKPLTGEEQAKALSQIGYAKVTKDSVFVYSHNDFLFSKNAIKDIRHIRYGELSETIVTAREDVNMTTCRVYPNPTQDMLIIDNADCETAHIFDITGQLLQSVSIQGDQTAVNVSSLPRGEYLLLLNTKTYKFIKQ